MITLTTGSPGSGMSGFAAMASGGAAQRSGAAATTPRAVTRGEENATEQTEQRAKVDWLHATFPGPDLSIEGFVALLGRMLGRPVSAIAKGGMFGFEKSVQLVAHIGSRQAVMGAICYGGESQLGRWLLQITGGGCGLIDDWSGVEGLLCDLDAKITRVDLAVDFLDGEWSVDDAVNVYTAGGFSYEQRIAPSHSLAGDWLGGDAGRTLYVGKSKNGKMLRVYEKGKQLGDKQSEWVRFEVQLGARDRVIPLDVLTRCDAYFAGAYPALGDLLEDVSAESIATITKSGVVSLAHLVFHLKRCYGKVLDIATGVLGATNAEFVDEVRVIGIPRRLQPSSLAAGLTWAQLLAQIRK